MSSRHPSVFTAMNVCIAMSIGIVMGVTPSYAHNTTLPECNPTAQGNVHTGHSVLVTDSTGTSHATYGSGTNVHVRATIDYAPGNGVTDVNRVRFLRYDPTGDLVDACTAVIHRGRSQPSGLWTVVSGCTPNVSPNPIGEWRVILCYETPNKATGVGFTRHVDEVTFIVQ